MNRNKNVNAKRTMALSMATVLSIISVAGCSNSSSSETEHTGTGVSTGDTYAVSTHGSEDGKEEIVYGIAAADGSVTDTIVSAWLKNPSEADTITDYSVLTDIENVKGNEDYTLDGDGNLIWNAAGHDIYYQGKTAETLPITVKITYELDGKECAPEELAGKSGHLKMTFTYTNHAKKEVEIDGEKTTIYQPFGVISGAMFDNEKVSNLTVTNGRAINDGEHSIVVGLALPGLSESLGLDALLVDGEPVDIDIPERVEIEADVTDFSLLTTITVADNNILKNMETDENGDFSLDDLRASITELTDASAELVDGSADLYDGAKELFDGVTALDEGAEELADGAGQVAGGASDLKDGIGQLVDQAPALVDGANQLAGGASDLNAGVSQIADGASDLNDGAAALASGIGQLSDGAKSLDDGLAALSGSVADMPAGTQSLVDGMQQIRSGLKSGSAQNPGIYEAAAGIAAGAAEAASKLPAVSAGIDGIESGLQSISDDYLDNAAAADAAAASYLQALQATGLTPEQEALLAQAMGYVTASQQIDEGVAAQLDVNSQKQNPAQAGELVTGLETIKAGTEALAAGLQSGSTENAGIYEAAHAIMNGTDALLGGTEQICAGLDTLNTGSANLVAGVAQLKAGSAALLAGADSANAGAQQLSAGTAQLKTGTQSLSDGASQLAAGASALASGAGAVKDGGDALYDGASRLLDGAGTLADGAQTLKDGTAALLDGAEQLSDGAKALSDGMKEFDEEGIQKLSDLLNADIGGLVDRFKAVCDFADEYTSFSGSADEADTGVKFIIRTDSISK